MSRLSHITWRFDQPVSLSDIHFQRCPVFEVAEAKTCCSWCCSTCHVYTHAHKGLNTCSTCLTTGHVEQELHDESRCCVSRWETDCFGSSIGIFYAWTKSAGGHRILEIDLKDLIKSIKWFLARRLFECGGAKSAYIFYITPKHCEKNQFFDFLKVHKELGKDK